MTVKIDKKHDFTAKLRQPDVLSRLKKYVEWQRAIRQGIKIETPNLAPISINLDLTTACNFRCEHCIDIDVINAKSGFDHEELLSSLNNMIERGLRSVILIGGGEPTLYQRFFEIVEYLKKHGIQVAISSNGSRGETLYNAARLLRPEMKDWFRLSLDAGTNDTWQIMHKPVLKTTLEEICGWVPKIRNVNPNLSIGFSFVITWDEAKNERGINVVKNINEVVAATKLAREYGFSYISFKPFLARFSSDGVEAVDQATINRTISLLSKAVDEAKTYETKDFKIIESTNLKVLRQGNWQDFMHQPKTCHMTMFRQVLSPIGLFHCPGFRGIEKSHISDKNAYRNGSIENTPKAVANILARFDAGKECADCVCLFNQANWLIENAINGEIDIEKIEPSEERHDYFF